MKTIELIELFVRPVSELGPQLTYRFWPAYRRAAAKSVADQLLGEEVAPSSEFVEALSRKPLPIAGSQTGQAMKRHQVLGLSQREVALILGIGRLCFLTRMPSFEQHCAESVTVYGKP